MDGHAHAATDEDPLRGPSATDARESLTYWRARLASLPVHRRAHRREARAMIVRWEARVRDAERARWGDGVVGRVAGSVAVWRDERGVSLTRRAASLLPGWVKLTAAALALSAIAITGLLTAAVLNAIF